MLPMTLEPLPPPARAESDPAPPVLVEEHVLPGVFRLTFNRPDVRNAMNRALVEATRATLSDLAERTDIACLILRGAVTPSGPVFVSGADIAEMKARTQADALRRINGKLCADIEAFPFVTIAAIEGFALGGGMEVALACDLRVASETAKFGQPEAGLGIIPGAGATYRLPRLVGLGRAKEIILTGRIFGAGEAHAIGLVQRLTPAGGADDGALALAQEVTANAPLALRFAKAALNASPEASTTVGMALESSMQAVLFDSPDKHARMQAFLDKRKKK